jgi:Flp pilus assembly protein TadG
MTLLARFRRDRSANIAVIFAIAVIPILAAVGTAVDYSMATRIQAKLQSAADAASIASIATNSAGYKAAAAMISDGSVSAGVNEEQSIFLGNASTIPSAAGVTVSVTAATVTKTGTALNSTLSFSANVPVTFMKAIGWQTMTVTGTSKSSSSLPMYLDFYLTLDVSGSMGLPSTTAEAVRMQSINPDNWVQYRTGCTLACHFAPQKSACTDDLNVAPPTNYPANPATNSNWTQQYSTNSYCMGYSYSRVSQIALAKLINMLPTATTPVTPKQVPGLPVSMLAGLPASLNTDPKWGLAAAQSCPTDGTDACIQLRLDAVGVALTKLFATANSLEKVSNEFRVGLYPFIRFLDQSYFPLTSNIAAGAPINDAATNLATLLDTNMDANLGSGGTHIDTALTSMNTLITSVGDGSASNKTLPYVFLITDGAQDNQVKGVPNGSWSGSNHDTVIDPVLVCKPLKDRGIKISVLYIPFVPINPVNASFANDEDDAANNNIPNIPASLSGCASPADAAGSYFYTATSPTEIQTSLNAMFNHAVQTAHITN